MTARSGCCSKKFGRLDSPSVREYLNNAVADLNPRGSRFFSALPRLQWRGTMRRDMAVRIAACGLALGLSLHMNSPAMPRLRRRSHHRTSIPALIEKVSKTRLGWGRAPPDGKVWLDTKNKRVVLEGEVCLREGQLEMFACLKGTKEHESIVAVPTKACRACRPGGARC